MYIKDNEKFCIFALLLCGINCAKKDKQQNEKNQEFLYNSTY